MILYGPLLWHIAMAAFLVLIRALSSRLGKAMRDDIGDVRFFTWAATLVGAAGFLHASAPFWALASWLGAACGLLGFALAAWAGWKTWGWIPSELARGRKGG